jgi:hypothetical protein
MITPHIVNMRMKRIQMLMSFANHELEYFGIAYELEDLENYGFDKDAFPPACLQDINALLDKAILSAFLCLHNDILECVGKIRECLVPVFVSNLLLVNRFSKNDADIGTLIQLPSDMLFEIQKQIYNNI